MKQNSTSAVQESLIFEDSVPDKFKRYRLRHPERVRAREHKYFEDNREMLRQKSLERYHRHKLQSRKAAKKWKATNKQRVREYARKNSARHRYGLSFDQLDALTESQGNRCAICGTPPTKRALDVDHDHQSGVVRALLCNRCNRLVALIESESNLAERAIEYLATHASKISSATKIIRDCGEEPIRTVRRKQVTGGLAA